MMKKLLAITTIVILFAACQEDNDAQPASPPGAPSGVSASDITSEGFTVSWSAVTGAINYDVDVATDSEFSSIVANQDEVTGTTATFTGLASSTPYYVRVNAMNDETSGLFSEVITVTTAAPAAGWLASNLDALGTIDLGGFVIPDTYVESNATEGSFAPAAYNGQLTRRAQLAEIVSISRDEPIMFDITAALADGTLYTTDGANSSSTNIRTKIDELNFDNGDTEVADDFAELATRFVSSAQDHFTVTASEGVAGMITTGDRKRHVDANGLEFAQILEKGLYGPLFYDQLTDDYLRPVQAGSENPAGNNETAAGADYASEGTSRQHAFDESFGYFGANPLTYPNADNTSNGDGEFIANYTFDFSDETEAAFGINLAQKIMDAYIIGRSALKAGEGFGPGQETTNEEVYEAARADIFLYVEAGIAAAAYHYLNDAIADVSDADKLHHLSEALAFIYALGFNSEGRISAAQVHGVLQELGWSSTDATLDGVYEINLWQVTDEQMQAAKDALDVAFPGFGAIPF